MHSSFKRVFSPLSEVAPSVTYIYVLHMKGLDGNGVSSSALLWSCVPVQMFSSESPSSSACSRTLARGFSRTLFHQICDSAPSTFPQTVNQNLTFKIKGSDRSLSGQTAKSRKKDRQINNEQKRYPASGKTYDGSGKEEDNTRMSM